MPATPISTPARPKQPVRACAPGPALFQLVVTTEYRTRRLSQDRLRSLHAEHPEIALFAAHDPLDYHELASGSGDAAHGMSVSDGRERPCLIHLTAP